MLYFLNASSVITPKILYEISELESAVNEMKNSLEGAKCHSEQAKESAWP